MPHTGVQPRFQACFYRSRVRTLTTRVSRFKSWKCS